MGRKAIGMMYAVLAAGMCFGETINVAAGETLELDLRECQVTNAADSVITLGAGATLKLVESTPSSTAGFAVYAMSGNGPLTADWPKVSDPDPLAKFAWDRFLGVRTNVYWDVTAVNVSPRYVEMNSAKWYIPEAGTCSFFMRLDDFGYLSIDGVPVLSSTAACQTLSTNGVELAAGWHDVLIIFGNGINPGPMGPIGGKGLAIAYNASNVPLTVNNVAAEGARFMDPGDGSGVFVRFWDDVNQNGVRDAGEKNADQGIVADGTNTVVFCRLPMGQFDADDDGMPDYWELQNGLSPQDPTDALEDPDGDGLINIHEYMAGCNIGVFDGTNTALYAFCDAIDRRIRRSEMLPVDIYAFSQFGSDRNANCWAYGIDLTCASPYNSSQWGLLAGTAISRKHIIYAHHFQLPIGVQVRFIGNDNVSCERTLIRSKSIAGTDVTIGLLSDELPGNISPTTILPPDFCLYIGDARRLPRLLLDREEKAFISDSNALSYRTTDSDGLVPVDANRSKYFKEVIVGDSGNPKFFVCGDTAIIACALHVFGTDASGRGPFVTYYRKRIQAVMDELCPGYTLRTFDLSTFRRLDDEE